MHIIVNNRQVISTLTLFLRSSEKRVKEKLWRANKKTNVAL